MIDFPASPTLGQKFVAPNGVTYQWNGTLWVTSSAGGTGDFCASGSGALPTSPTTTQPATIVSGNAGLWYNSSNGQYKPPAGRYYLYGTLTGNNPSASSAVQMIILKNGTTIANTLDQIPAAGMYGYVSPFVAIDANGADVFTWQIAGYAAGTTAFALSIGAFPLTGMQGPPGAIPGGGLSLYQEVLLAANAATLQVAWPSGVRKIEIEYLALNVGNVGDTVIFRAAQNGVVNSANAYATQYLFGTGSTPSAGLVSPQTYWTGLGGMVNTKGTIKPAVTPTQAFAEHTQVGNSATAGYALEAFYWGAPGANMNGIQMFNLSGTLFLPGSFLRAYVVP